MSLIANKDGSAAEQSPNRLMMLAAVFLFVYSTALTFSPAVRLHSWQVDYRWNHWIGFGVWLVFAFLTHTQLAKYVPGRDPFLFPVICLLVGWGLLSIWRLDVNMGIRQTIWLSISGAAFAGGLRIPNLLDWLRRYKYVWLTSGLILTGLTFLIGIYPGGNGPHLWLGCCGIYLQPSEPLKLLVIIFLAAYLAERIPLSFNLPHLLTPTLIMVGIALAMLAFQRDLGTASLFILLYSIILYLASQRKRMLIASIATVLAAGIAGYLLFDVVRIRIDAWLNPWLDPSGRSYQIVQSLLAVAAGGLMGRGPGLGSPGVVPVAHSDFIFASIAEETGLIGAYALFSLYAILAGRGFRAALRAANNYQRYLAAGITTYIISQAILIMGGNLRLLPLTGVTLPFISYGGSSLLTVSLSSLILIIISNRTNEDEPAPLSRTTPYLVISTALFVGLLALALVDAWWAIIRSDALLTRSDNPRRGISDRYVIRGSLLDRNNNPLAQTTGIPGDYLRIYEYPALSTTTGYNNALYGQAGLEAGLDEFLRGFKGSPESEYWSNYIIYGQPPPGSDIQLTLDLTLQKQADSLMTGHRGALVLLNAESGEILAMASHPYFDPNTLEADWQKLIQDPQSPLLNRATLGQYPAGPALGPFLFSFAYAQQTRLISRSITDSNDPLAENCAVEPSVDGVLTFARLVAAGCPAASTALQAEIDTKEQLELYQSLGLFSQVDLPLETYSSKQSETVGDEISVTPLQMAAAAAAFANQGKFVEPKIVSSVLNSSQKWDESASDIPSETMLGNDTAAATRMLSVSNTLTWETTAKIQRDAGQLSWYLAGTLPDFAGTPYSLVIILENGSPRQAIEIGRAYFEYLLGQQQKINE